MPTGLMAPIPDPINEFISPKWNVEAAIGRPRILSFVMRKTAPFRVANGRPYTFVVKNLIDSSLCNSLEFVFFKLTEREVTSLSALSRSEK